MTIDYRASDRIIDSIDELITDALVDLDQANRVYVLKMLADVVSNQLFDLEEVTA